MMKASHNSSNWKIEVGEPTPLCGEQVIYYGYYPFLAMVYECFRLYYIGLELVLECFQVRVRF